MGTMIAETITELLEDVLAGYYKWLDDGFKDNDVDKFAEHVKKIISEELKTQDINTFIVQKDLSQEHTYIKMIIKLFQTFYLVEVEDKRYENYLGYAFEVKIHEMCLRKTIKYGEDRI